jgi:hypothetical protein
MEMAMKNRRERKELDWHLGDIEQRCGFAGGKYTDVNMLLAEILACVLTAGFYISLCHLEYILHRRQLKEFFEWYKSSKYNEIDNDIIEASDVHIDIGDERE